MAMKVLVTACAATVFLVAGSPRASTLMIPNTFQAGDTAKASEVNANFEAVKSAVDDNDERISKNRPLITRLDYADREALSSANSFTKLRTVGTFNKKYDDSVIKLSWNSSVTVSTASDDRQVAQVQLRVDGMTDNHDLGSGGGLVTVESEPAAQGGITVDAVHTETIFRNLSAGTHDVELWMEFDSEIISTIENERRVARTVLVEEIRTQ